MKGFLIVLLMATSVSAQPNTLKFEVAGLACDGCATNVETALKSIRGVTNVSVDIEAQRVQVEAGRTVSQDEIRYVLRKLGFEPKFAEDPKLLKVPAEERARLDIQATPIDAAIDLRRDLAPGKITILEFWTPRCSSCDSLMARLEWMVYENRDIALRTVQLRPQRSAAGMQATRQFRITTLPYVRVYDAGGKYIGETTETLPSKIQALIEKARKKQAL